MEKLGHQASHKTCDTQFFLPIRYAEASGGGVQPMTGPIWNSWPETESNPDTAGRVGIQRIAQRPKIESNKTGKKKVNEMILFISNFDTRG